ncbi:hypothetical protein [Haliangium sp.]|uniref:hypothetical protein n=1 Tax=Haliangium sp. TaxID=2663208 RepID=UPI003D1400A5
MSGAGEGLDQLIMRVCQREPFDAAVVAWDLVPAWNPEEDFCRWQETLDFYRLLSESECLPEVWKQQACKRFEGLNRRPRPSARRRPPRLAKGMILALCMEPMFEALLAGDEAAVKRALGVRGAPKGWPRIRWNDDHERRPDARLIGPAVQAACALRPRPKALAGVRGSWHTNKDGWGEFLLRRLLADDDARPAVLDHPLCRRLAELGVPADASSA